VVGDPRHEDFANLVVPPRFFRFGHGVKIMRYPILPRRLASMSACTMFWSGMKYAWVISIVAVARSMASRYIPRIG
jgi:hypothetical protein